MDKLSEEQFKIWLSGQWDKISFPYSRLSGPIDSEDIKTKYLNYRGDVVQLDNSAGEIVGYTGHRVTPNFLITMDSQAYRDFDFVSERMNEKFRSYSKGLFVPDLVSRWTKSDLTMTENGGSLKALVIEKLVENQYQKYLSNPTSWNLTYQSVREAYEANVTYFDRPFVMRLSWIKTILQRYFSDLSSIKILDPNAGSGEIFLASVVLDLNYTGLFLKEKNKEKLEIPSDFGVAFNSFGASSEKQKISAVSYSDSRPVFSESFDLVFTSFSAFRDRGGPYNGSFSDWFCWNILGGLISAWNSLKSGGYLIFHTRDHDRYDVVDALLIAIQDLFPKSSWVESLALQDQHTQRMYMVCVFQKSTGVIINTLPGFGSAERESEPEKYSFAYLYPELRDKYVEILMMDKIQEYILETTIQPVVANEVYNRAWESLIEPLADCAIQINLAGGAEEKNKKLNNLFKELFINNPWRLFPIVTILDRDIVYDWLSRVLHSFKV
jgi:hypothetical protein